MVNFTLQSVTNLLNIHNFVNVCVCKLIIQTSYIFIQIFLILYNQRSQYWLLQNTTGHRAPVRITPLDHNLLSSTSKTILNVIYQITVDPMVLNLLEEPTMWELFKCFIIVHVYTTYYPCHNNLNLDYPYYLTRRHFQ